jgi:hypothetical protein
MPSHAPDDSLIAPSASDALDEFAVEDRARSVSQTPDGADGVFCFKCEAQPEPTLSVSASLLDLAPANAPHEGIREPLSRIEAKEAMRRNSRRSPGNRFAVTGVAVRNRVTRVSVTVKSGTGRTTSAAARRLAGVKRRAIESAASVSQRTSGVARNVKRKVRRLALRMQSRTEASRARLVAERETMTSLACRGVAALARTSANATHRSRDVAINLEKQSLDVIRDGGRAWRACAREIRNQAGASKGEIGLVFAAAQRRMHGGSTAIATAGANLSRCASDATLLAWYRSIAGAKSVTAHSARAWAFTSREWPAGSRAADRPFAEPALDHQEFHGAVVAVLLAVVVVGYGGFLAVFLGTPTDARVTRVTSHQAGAPQAIAAPTAPVVGEHSLGQAAALLRPASVRTTATDIGRRGAVITPTARTLTTLWQRRDTRSLDRAFATLRGETLAFRRCGMRMTDADRAVARCEGVVTTSASDGAPSSRSATWTIDFQRTSGRWLITRVTTR